MDTFKNKNLTELYRLYLAEDEVDADFLLEEILSNSLNIAEKFFNGKSEGDNFQKSDAEDLIEITAVKLNNFLKNQSAEILVDEIEDFEAYLKIVCKSVWANFWRSKFVNYFNLQNRILYLFKKENNLFFVRVNESKQRICGFIKSKNERTLFSNSAIVDAVKINIPNHQTKIFSDLIAEIFKTANGWLFFNDLTAIAAELRGIKQIPRLEINPAEFFNNPSFSKDNLDERQYHRAELKFLWNEICELSRLQKLCLLYNLRDKKGSEVNTIWFESGVATLAELAHEFEINKNEMARLLTELPFSDIKIAEILNIESLATVSNLRKVARTNLKRRLEGKQKRRKKQ